MYKPKIILLVDVPNWAFDHCAKSMAKRLCHNFDFEIKYASLGEKLDARKTDLIHIFFWGDHHYKGFGFQKEQIIKDVSSLKWYDENSHNLSIERFVSTYLSDCSCIVTPSISICNLLETHVQDLFHLPNSVETDLFRPPQNKRCSANLTIGWVGRPDDLTKGLLDILVPASANYNFLATNGIMSTIQLLQLYKKIDVLAIASIAEGEPIPLLEGMAAGCFPVVTNVGLVPEIIVDGSNGLIVNRDVESFRNAFDWCARNLTMVRNIGEENRMIIKNRSWDKCVCRFEEVYRYAYEMKCSEVKNKPSIIFQFPPMEMGSRGDLDENKRSLSQMRSLIILILSDAWSRFWLGDRFRASFLVRTHTAIIGRLGATLQKIRSAFKPDQFVEQFNYDGQILSFAEGGNGSKYLLSGWSQAEGWGIWSDGPIAKVALADASLAGKGHVELVIEARGFVNQSQPKQRVRVRVNGADAGELLLGWDITSTSLQVPAEALKSSLLKIELVPKTLISPATTGISSDRRRLGVGLKSLQLRDGTIFTR